MWSARNSIINRKEHAITTCLLASSNIFYCCWCNFLVLVCRCWPIFPSLCDWLDFSFHVHSYLNFFFFLKSVKLGRENIWIHITYPFFFFFFVPGSIGQIEISRAPLSPFQVKNSFFFSPNIELWYSDLPLNCKVIIVLGDIYNNSQNIQIYLFIFLTVGGE